MSDDKKGTAFEGTIDSLVATGKFLWDFLSAPPKEPTPDGDSGPSILDIFPPSAEPKPDGQIPAEVIDTEGEDA